MSESAFDSHVEVEETPHELTITVNKHGVGAGVADRFKEVFPDDE